VVLDGGMVVAAQDGRADFEVLTRPMIPSPPVPDADVGQFQKQAIMQGRT
jgi:hypothetical protein